MTSPAGPSRAADRRRALFLVVSDLAGRTWLLAGPYPSAEAAAARVPAVGERLGAPPALAGLGHLTIAEGNGDATTYFGPA
jgi:hypothetical protein